MRKYYRGGGRGKRTGQAQAPLNQNDDDVINPLDFLEKEYPQGREGDETPLGHESDEVPLDRESEETPVEQPHVAAQGLFVVGTDVGVGKTIAICSLGALLQQHNRKVVAVKPVQCGGEEARLFMDNFDMSAGSEELTPYSFSEKISPYFAFKKNNVAFDMQKVVAAYQQASTSAEIAFVEAPGGLAEPLTEQYYVFDMAKALGLSLLIVAPLRRGSLNHLVMTVRLARECGLSVRGVLFTEPQGPEVNAVFMAKVKALRDLLNVPVIGIIPFLANGSEEEIQKKCHRKISFKTLLGLAQDKVSHQYAPAAQGQSQEKKPVSSGRRPSRRSRPSRRRNRVSRPSA
ncbi:MAG TPA: dethiobiotin synthase [Candidatus Bathyarchaeia archaeon]|nr:dethiobiotin synthase [Candidatus Bathyarchaeia archaeon]